MITKSVESKPKGEGALFLAFFGGVVACLVFACGAALGYGYGYDHPRREPTPLRGVYTDGTLYGAGTCTSPLSTNPLRGAFSGPLTSTGSFRIGAGESITSTTLGSGLVTSGTITLGAGLASDPRPPSMQAGK
jgi:hypothetical protein